jgi:hypothetical protein
MTASRVPRLPTLLVGVALLLAACAPAEDQAAEPATPGPVPTADSSPTSPTEVPRADDTDAPDAGAELSAEALRLTLEEQLGHHAVLAVEAMRAGVTGREDFDAAAAALADNTDDLVASIELVYGADGADAFRQLWEDHIGFFVDYTVGLAEGDDQAQSEALARLDQYRQDFATFLSTASDGEIDAGTVAASLQEHVDQLVTQIDAYHSGDFDTAFAQEREAYAHMFTTAQALAGGIAAQFPDRFPAEQAATGGEVPAIDLQSQVGQQLGEHAHAAIVAMQRGVTGAEDFDAAAAALADNTDDLVASIELVYGADGADAFRQLWEDHIGFFVDYTVGLAEGDDQAQSEALARLDQYRQDFATFLSTASDGEIDAGTVADGLQIHVDQLVAQIDAYADGDFTTAHTQAYQAYGHMYMTAEALAGGIAAQFPDRFPA